MSKVKVSAGITVNNKRIEATSFFDFGSDIEDITSKFGKKQVYLLALREAKRKYKAAVRAELKAGTLPEEISEKMKNWRPDVKHEVVVKSEKLVEDIWDSLPKAKQEAIIAKAKQSKQK